MTEMAQGDRGMQRDLGRPIGRIAAAAGELVPSGQGRVFARVRRGEPRRLPDAARRRVPERSPLQQPDSRGRGDSRRADVETHRRYLDACGYDEAQAVARRFVERVGVEAR